MGRRSGRCSLAIGEAAELLNALVKGANRASSQVRRPSEEPQSVMQRSQVIWPFLMRVARMADRLRGCPVYIFRALSLALPVP